MRPMLSTIFRGFCREHSSISWICYISRPGNPFPFLARATSSSAAQRPRVAPTFDVQSQPLKIATAQWILQCLKRNRNSSDLHLSFTVVGKPRITYGLRGAVVKISAAASSGFSPSKYPIVPHSTAIADDDPAASAFIKATTLEFQQLCAVADSEMVRFCGFCGHQVTRGCTMCTISSFYRQISFLSDKTIKDIVNNRSQWAYEELPVYPAFQDVLFSSEDSVAAATGLCSMLNSVTDMQLRSVLCLGHHTRPLSFSASDCSSISNFLHSFGLDSVSLRPNIKRASGDILHQLLHNFCSFQNTEWRPARPSAIQLPVFDLFATGCPDALFRSIPLELKSVETAEAENDDGVLAVNRGSRKFPPSSAIIWKWLRQISVYQRSHAPNSHRALLLIANRSSRRIGAYEVSPRNISFFDSYCLKVLAQRPALARYLDAIRPYCKATALIPRSSHICEVFTNQKMAARSAMQDHAERLQAELACHVSTANAFIAEVQKSGSIPAQILMPSSLNSNSKLSDAHLEVPDFGRAFINLRTSIQLFDKLQLAESSFQMEQSYWRNVELLMECARALHKAALARTLGCTNPTPHDHAAVSILLKFIKSLTTILRNSAGPGMGMKTIPRSKIEACINELIGMEHLEFARLQSEHERQNDGFWGALASPSEQSTD